MTPTADETYVPGVCNINREEIAYRRRWRDIGAVVTVLLFVTLLMLSSNRWLRIVVFLPAFIGAINYLQTKNHFCVSYAGAGMQNATEGSKTASKVNDAAHAADRAKARKMNAQATVSALLITCIVIAI